MSKPLHSVDTEPTFKDYFQDNLLDGEDINDCGGAMIDAKSTYETLNEIHQTLLVKAQIEELKNIPGKRVDSTSYLIETKYLHDRIAELESSLKGVDYE